MKKKIRIGILFGGQSEEHEVSVQSAKNVYEALDKEKYEPILIGITKKGKWVMLSNQEFSRLTTTPSLPAFVSNSVLRHSELSVMNKESLDVVFPVLHGPYGEDGTIQGFLKLLGIPYIGAGVLGSAVGMDKDVMKRLLRDAGLPIADFLVFHRKDKKSISFTKIKKELGVPFFIKPANLGSSVGVSKVGSPEEFVEALEKAFKFDTKILIEEGIIAREIECSVLGNEEPIASKLGEIIVNDNFYSYESKYINEDGALLEIPAKMSSRLERKIQKMAINVFNVLCCSGLARVDFFVTTDERIYVNEINTIPGFTKISMYPKLWEASGIGYTELLDRLIQLAQERHFSLIK